MRVVVDVIAEMIWVMSRTEKFERPHSGARNKKRLIELHTN